MPPQHPEARRRQAPVPLPNHQQPTVSLEQLLNLQTRLEVMDIGAACIAEEPVYKRHLDRGIAHLHAFEGDQRQIARIHEVYGSKATVYP